MTSMTHCIDAPWLVDGRKSCRVVSCRCQTTLQRHDTARLRQVSDFPVSCRRGEVTGKSL